MLHPFGRLTSPLVIHRSGDLFTESVDIPTHHPASGTVLGTAMMGRLSLRKDAERSGRRARQVRPTRRRRPDATARRDARRLAARRGSGTHRAATRRRQADGARATRAVARSRDLRRTRCLRHVGRHRERWDPRRRRGDGLRDRRGTARLRLQPGLHRLRWIAVRGVRAQGLQDHGSRHEGRRADHRSQRFRRGADPGRCRIARRVRRDLPAQRPGVGRRATDLADPRPVRRRRRVFTGDDRLHDHGRRDELHVRHRTERREGRDARGRRCGVPRRRDDAHDHQRRRTSRRAR